LYHLVVFEVNSYLSDYQSI